jgi:hypothetical protein
MDLSAHRCPAHEEATRAAAQHRVDSVPRAKLQLDGRNELFELWVSVPKWARLTLRDVEEWQKDIVKQGERPRGPNTDKLRLYLRGFHLSTDKSKTRAKMLNILKDFLSGKTRNQLGKTIHDD